MNIKNRHQALLERPMTRHEFLQHVAAGLLLVIGGGLVTQFLSRFDESPRAAQGNAYGTRPYGR